MQTPFSVFNFVFVWNNMKLHKNGDIMTVAYLSTYLMILAAGLTWFSKSQKLLYKECIDGGLNLKLKITVLEKQDILFPVK